MTSRILGWVVAGAVAAAVGLVAQDASAAPSPGKKLGSGSGKSKGGGNFGVGLSLGDPMGLSGKAFLAPNHALQADLGWAPMHHGDGRFGIDYLWHPGVFASGPVADFLPYVGLGVGIMFWGDRCSRAYYYDDNGNRRYRGNGHWSGRCSDGGAAMFLRAPILGLGVHWKKAPIDTMVEGSWSPYLIYPDLSHGDFSFKVRYYF